MKLTLKDCCEFINGGTWTASEYADYGYPILKVSNFDKNSISYNDVSFLNPLYIEKYSRNILRHNDVVVATVGSHPSLANSAAGRCITIPLRAEGYLLNQNAVCVRSLDEKVVSQKYLGFLVKSQTFQHFIQQRGKGAANQMRIPISGIKDFEFNFPSIEIQYRVASVLSAYEDMIENNLKRIKLLEEKARLTYEEWFVRMKFPGHEVAPIDETTGLLRGWKKATLGEMLELKYGKALKAEDRIQGSFNVYGSSGVVGTHAESLVEGPGIILGRKGNVGSVFWESENFYPIDTVYYVNSTHSLYFLYFNLQRQNFINNDAAVPGLNRNSAYLKTLVLPAKELLDLFDSQIRTIFELIKNLRIQNQLLKEARDLLLPRLMSGVVDVDELLWEANTTKKMTQE